MPWNERKAEEGGAQLKRGTWELLGYGDVLYLDEHDGYLGIYICQNSSKYALRIVTIHCMKMKIK